MKKFLFPLISLCLLAACGLKLHADKFAYKHTFKAHGNYKDVAETVASNARDCHDNKIEQQDLINGTPLPDSGDLKNIFAEQEAVSLDIDSHLRGAMVSWQSNADGALASYYVRVMAHGKNSVTVTLFSDDAEDTGFGPEVESWVKKGTTDCDYWGW